MTRRLACQLFLFFFLVLVGHHAWSGEFTGAGKQIRDVLLQNNINPDQLEASGHKLLFGEMTGAGKRMDLDRIKIVVTKQTAHWLAQASHIEYRHPSPAKTLNDVNLLEFDRRSVNANEIVGMVVK